MTRHVPTADHLRFQLALPLTDLAQARAFYGAFLACAQGRGSPGWVGFDSFGHALENKAYADPGRLFAA